MRHLLFDMRGSYNMFIATGVRGHMELRNRLQKYAKMGVRSEIFIDFLFTCYDIDLVSSTKASSLNSHTTLWGYKLDIDNRYWRI